MPHPLQPSDRRFLALALLIGLVVSTLFLLAIIHLHEDISHPRIESLDRSILQSIHAHDTPFLTALARTLSFIGSPITLLPAVPLAAALLWSRRLRRDALLLLISMGGSSTLDTALKLHYRRIRPDLPWAFVHERSFSFPSGHSVLAVTLYGILTYLLMSHLAHTWQRAIIILASLTLIVGIGLSRIYLGAHFPSDVLAGYLVGLTWLLPVIATDQALKRRQSGLATNGL